MPPKASTSSGEPLKKRQKSAAVKPVSQSTFRKLEELEKRIYEAALESGGDIIFKALQELANVSDNQIFVENVNALLRKHLLTAHTSGENSFLRAVPLAQAKATGNLEDETRLVLTVIKDADDMGIWKRTLKTRTGLHAKTLQNCLKDLEGRKLIKTVKGVKYPTRKLYMAYDLQPSTELTGGPWYTDERELDLDFIGKLLERCERYIEQNSCVDGDRNNETMFPKAYWPFFPTLWHIRNFITESKLVTASPLTDRDYQDLLDILVADGKIQPIKIRRHPKDVWQEIGTPKQSVAPIAKKKRRRPVDNDDDSEDIDEDDSDEEDSDDNLAAPSTGHFADMSLQRAGPPGSEDYIVYRTVHCFYKSGEHNIPLGVWSGLLDAPCGMCPVRHHCDNIGRPRIAAPATSAAHKRLKDPLALRIPSASDHGEALGGDGVWRGGGTRGSTAKGDINPEECHYYTEWLRVADAVPRPSDMPPNRQFLDGYRRDPYQW